ncbi:ethanolamine ammonia-lyase subunit EutC [Emergencia timonensis]|uniref:ethanolamine ammonia-lyase subunit EutC n=1 Tax=Emergencia timonensis TaxID=1776384 RepID=UPI003991190D
MLNQNINEEAIMEVVKKVLGDLEVTEVAQADTPLAGDESLTDIAMIPEEKICLVENPRNKEALMRLKRSTPARTATGRTGDREKTIITIRKMANLSAAVDAVWTPLNREFVSSLGYPVLKSMPQSKEEYLMRPDLGVILDDENMNLVRTQLQKNPDVQLIIGEGQSNQGLEKSMPELLPALLQGLQSNKINYGTPCFVEYTRVGIGDLIGQEVGAKVVCVILGERPGLLSWDGLGCYITYAPKVGILESKRTCVSNIQDNGGTPPAEAGAYIADLIARILKEGKSGVDLII